LNKLTSGQAYTDIFQRRRRDPPKVGVSFAAVPLATAFIKRRITAMRSIGNIEAIDSTPAEMADFIKSEKAH
jgi:hypothetical protein